MKKYFGILLMLLLMLKVEAQPIDYTLSFKGIGDNREFFSPYNDPQTILGTRGIVTLGTKIDSVHRVKAGIDYFYEFGSEWGELNPDFVFYYEALKGPWMFRMGSFSREEVVDYPLALVADDYTYYKPNMEGLFIQHKKDRWHINVLVDWFSRQDSIRREQFMAGINGKVNWGKFFIEENWYMFHNAGSMNRETSYPIEDYNGGVIMAGVNLSKLMSIDLAVIKTGLLNSMWHRRSTGTGYAIASSSYSELHLEHKGYGIKSIFNFGDQHHFFLGDNFYKNTTSYVRTNFYFTPINFEHVKGKFTWSLHLANGDLDNQQQFSLVYLFSHP